MPPARGKEKSFVCLVFLRTARERERKTIPRADPPAVHQILCSTDRFLNNESSKLPAQSNCTARLHLTLNMGSKDEESWDKVQPPKPKTQ